MSYSLVDEIPFRFGDSKPCSACFGRSGCPELGWYWGRFPTPAGSPKARGICSGYPADSFRPLLFLSRTRQTGKRPPLGQKGVSAEGGLLGAGGHSGQECRKPDDPSGVRAGEGRENAEEGRAAVCGANRPAAGLDRSGRELAGGSSGGQTGEQI